MLVDLARNDIGRVCDYGSVEVKDLMIIERYSHVMHIVSQVEGTLMKKCTPYDLIRATFPAGTLSGAPKIRAATLLQADALALPFNTSSFDSPFFILSKFLELTA